MPFFYSGETLARVAQGTRSATKGRETGAAARVADPTLRVYALSTDLKTSASSNSI